MKPALVVLAAGASSRLGRCKALVELGGRSVLERLLAAGTCLDETQPLVVTGADHAAIAAAAPPGCRIVFNPRWAQGRSGAVLLAHRALPDRALCLAPVDVPLVPAEVFSALAQEWDALGAPPRGWLAPRPVGVDGRRGDSFGHPVVLGPALLALLEAREASHSLRELRREARPLASVGVFSIEVLDDLDTPSDLERLRKRAPSS